MKNHIREALIAKRNKLNTIQLAKEYKDIFLKLEDLRNHWIEVSKQMTKYTHGNKYDLKKTIPHELQLALTYWGAANHMINIS